MRPSTLLAATAASAVATYFLDPDLGRRRRAIARSKVTGRLRHLDDAGKVVATDIGNRLKGTVARARLELASTHVPDDVLVERVRAKLGRFVSHPRALTVTARDGDVMLQGPVLTHEVNRVIHAARSVPGVRSVIDRLDPHHRREHVPSLQGGHPRRQRIDILQEQWSPATRTLAGGAGAALLARALTGRSPFAAGCALAGAAMLLRATTNRSLLQLLGRRGPYIRYVKTIHVAAAPEHVFALWQDFENFPQFMRNIRSVRRSTDTEGCWHWEVTGPLGRTVHWEAAITERRPNERIAWRTMPGSQVESEGVVHFQPEDGGTRVQIEMRYNPPGAALGHLIAWLAGTDPLTEMDEDLMRLKGYLETGKPARDAAALREARANGGAARVQAPA